jgi:hypothetical protein
VQCLIAYIMKYSRKPFLLQTGKAIGLDDYALHRKLHPPFSVHLLSGQPLMACIKLPFEKGILGSGAFFKCIKKDESFRPSSETLLFIPPAESLICVSWIRLSCHEIHHSNRGPWTLLIPAIWGLRSCQCSTKVSQGHHKVWPIQRSCSCGRQRGFVGNAYSIEHQITV